MQRDLRDRFEVAPIPTVLSAAALSAMLQWTNGHYNPKAILVVIAAWILALLAVFGRVRAPKKWLDDRALLAVLGCAVAVQLGLMVTETPTVEMRVPDPAQMHLFNFMLVTVAVLTGIGLAGRGPLRSELEGGPSTSRAGLADKLWFPAVVILHFVMGRLVISFVASPHIDVWSIEMDSARALLDGINPFGLTFPDPYGGRSPYFPPGVSVNGRLMFGFVYPPLSLLLCLPGYLLGGDTRWSMLVAMEIGAVLMAYARPGKLSKVAAVAFLFMPRTFFVMDRAWTDSFVVMITAAVCYTALKKPRWAFLFIGMYVCLKQHMFLGIPALFMLVPRPIPWKNAGILTLKGAAVAAVLTVPFVLWGPSVFFRSVLDIREVFRTDSLGLLAHLHNTNTATLSKWSGLVAVVPVILLGLWRAPRTPAGFAMFAGTTHFTLYLFSTHAFCNEYYNVVGALYCAVAVWGPYDGKVLVPADETRAATASSARAVARIV